MLAVNDEGVLFLFFAALFVTIWIAMANRQKLRERRLDVVRQAMEHPTLDDATRRTMIEALANPPRSEWMRNLGQHLGFLARNLILVVGWLAMFVGIALWIIGANSRAFGEMMIGGIISTCVGFALVTFPFAVRELDRGQQRERP